MFIDTYFLNEVITHIKGKIAKRSFDHENSSVMKYHVPWKILLNKEILKKFNIKKQDISFTYCQGLFKDCMQRFHRGARGRSKFWHKPVLHIPVCTVDSTYFLLLLLYHFRNIFKQSEGLFYSSVCFPCDAHPVKGR